MFMSRSDFSTGPLRFEPGATTTSSFASPIVLRENGGKFLKVAIADNGPGIPDSIKDQLFNPFFTTKPVGQGTGLGLAISYKIVVDGHGGTIKISQISGGGTEFLVKIPISNERPESSRKKELSPQILSER